MQEVVYHSKELGFSVYAAYLDTARAFDMCDVRHSALFIKIKDDLCIREKCLRLIIDSFTDIKGCASINGVTSDTFLVLQSCRQGGVISTWSYLLFIDLLLVSLENSRLGVTIGDIHC